MSDTSVFERDRAYMLLLDLILSGKLATEQALSERKLADNLQMGRTPVREAIRRMTREGLIEVRPARGTYVRELTIDQVQEIYEARIGIEGMAAFLAAERGPTNAFPEFRKQFEDMIAKPADFDLTETHKVGQDFHIEIFRAAKNRYLVEIYEPLRLRHRVTLGLPRFYNHERVRESVKEHLAILDTIECSDGAKARQLICDHLIKGLDVRSRIFEQLAAGHQPDLKKKVDG